MKILVRIRMSGRGANAARAAAGARAAGAAPAPAPVNNAATSRRAVNNAVREERAVAENGLRMARFRNGLLPVNPFEPGPPVDAAMAAALAGAVAVPEENPFAGSGNPFGAAPAAPRAGVLSGFVAAVSGLLGNRGAAVGPAPPAAAAVPLPVVAHVAAAPQANAAVAAGVSWWRSAMQALAPVERLQMLYGYVTKKTEYNVVDFVGGLMKSGVKPEDIVKLIEYNPSESLPSADPQIAFNDEYTGKQLMAAIVDFAIILEYYKKTYSSSSNNRRRSGVTPAVINNAVELLFEKLTIMLHAYTLHEHAKSETSIALAPATREASLVVNYAGTEQAYFGERSLSVDIPAILNDALTNVEGRRPKLDAIFALLGKEGDINGNSLGAEGFSRNIIANLERLAGAGAGAGANMAVFAPILARNGLVDTLKKLERLPRVGGRGISGISGILAEEVGKGVGILTGVAADQQRALDNLSAVADFDDDDRGLANVPEPAGTQSQGNSMNEFGAGPGAGPNNRRANGIRNPVAAQLNNAAALSTATVPRANANAAEAARAAARAAGRAAANNANTGSGAGAGGRKRERNTRKSRKQKSRKQKARKTRKN